MKVLFKSKHEMIRVTRIAVECRSADAVSAIRSELATKKWSIDKLGISSKLRIEFEKLLETLENVLRI